MKIQEFGMTNRQKITFLSLILLLPIISYSQGIHKDSPLIVDWATNCEVERGWINALDTSLGKVDFGLEQDATNKSNPFVVSLGDGGNAILTFFSPIYNGKGADFVVFENSFDGHFLELAHVEVSSDGANYVRFPSISNSQTGVQVGEFDSLIASNFINLAGNTKAQFGTSFDLEELKNDTNLDVNNITHIKIIDVIGSIDPMIGSFDSKGNIINDPFPTAYNSSGFDLDAVGVINTYQTTQLNEIKPSPFLISNSEKIEIIIPFETFIVYDISGKLLLKTKKQVFQKNELSCNTCIVKIVDSEKIYTQVLIK
jgi:hypothetical protein